MNDKDFSFLSEPVRKCTFHGDETFGLHKQLLLTKDRAAKLTGYSKEIWRCFSLLRENKRYNYCNKSVIWTVRDYYPLSMLFEYCLSDGKLKETEEKKKYLLKMMSPVKN